MRSPYAYRVWCPADPAAYELEEGKTVPDPEQQAKVILAGDASAAAEIFAHQDDYFADFACASGRPLRVLVRDREGDLCAFEVRGAVQLVYTSFIVPLTDEEEFRENGGPR